MSTSNRERQRKYRERLRNEGENTRINSVVSPATVAQLDRLSRYYGVDKRKILEDLIKDFELDTLRSLDPKDHEKYAEKQLNP